MMHSGCSLGGRSKFPALKWRMSDRHSVLYEAVVGDGANTGRKNGGNERAGTSITDLRYIWEPCH